MGCPWSDERRARQREAIQRWRPWEKSTGPRTEAGKAASSANSYRHGARCREVREAGKHVRDWLRAMRRGV